MAYLLIWVAMLAVTEIISRHLGWIGIVVFYLLVASVAAAIATHQIHRRGQTIAEAMAASRAGRCDRAEQELRRRNTRQERSRHEAALPWLNDRQLSPGELSGVMITPAPGTRGDPSMAADPTHRHLSLAARRTQDS
jgi:Ni/Co efflux regulator RcnB